MAERDRFRFGRQHGGALRRNPGWDQTRFGRHWRCAKPKQLELEQLMRRANAMPVRATVDMIFFRMTARTTRDGSSACEVRYRPSSDSRGAVGPSRSVAQSGSTGTGRSFDGREARRLLPAMNSPHRNRCAGSQSVCRLVGERLLAENAVGVVVRSREIVSRVRYFCRVLHGTSQQDLPGLPEQCDRAPALVGFVAHYQQLEKATITIEMGR